MNTSFARALICSFTIAGSVFLSETARAQAIFRTEVYPVQTVTLSTADFLLGKKDGKPAMIAGELRIPKPGTDRLPAVRLQFRHVGGRAEQGWLCHFCHRQLHRPWDH